LVLGEWAVQQRGAETDPRLSGKDFFLQSMKIRIFSLGWGDRSRWLIMQPKLRLAVTWTSRFSTCQSEKSIENFDFFCCDSVVSAAVLSTSAGEANKLSGAQRYGFGTFSKFHAIYPIVSY